MEVKRV
jgi:hypothetical protein